MSDQIGQPFTADVGDPCPNCAICLVQTGPESNYVLACNGCGFVCMSNTTAEVTRQVADALRAPNPRPAPTATDGSPLVPMDMDPAVRRLLGLE